LLDKVPKQDRLLVDIRSFEQYQACHFKGSFQIDSRAVDAYCQELLSERQTYPTQTKTEEDPQVASIHTYLQFLLAYSRAKPKNLIVIIGDKEDLGNTFGVNLLLTLVEPLPRLCILKGGIDAIKVECPQVLRKGSSQTTVQSLLA